MLSAGSVVRSFIFDGKVNKRKKDVSSLFWCSDMHYELHQ